MNLQNQKAKSFLSILKILEFFYLAVSVVIVFGKSIPAELLVIWLNQWVLASYFILPLLLFKNIAYAIYSGGSLTRADKGWTLVRCILYFTLSFFAYPLILSI